MRRAPFVLLAILLALPAPGAAQPVVFSPGPEKVSVTVYRDPGRGRFGSMDPEWLEGYALITETRTVRLPAGDSEIRFEGVAGGILPASAIVSGLPGGVTEKNRDARLLSPGTLVDAALGRRVHIRRTSNRTGAVTEGEAIIRSGPEGVVLQTRDGVEALRCTGLPETLVYDGVPEGLSARPTLAVTTRTPAAATATIRLSYLSSDFDWDAYYIARIAPDGRTLDLFAWLTLANGNDESFAEAQTQAVAGKLNRNEDEDDGEPSPVSSQISLQCWPAGTTSDIPLIVPSEPERYANYGYSDGESIVVTGSRIARENLVSNAPVTVMTARQEELGDLKLYRIPEPVTVAAHGQKQVALLRRPAVSFDRFYGATVTLNEPQGPRPAYFILRTKNLAARGLGVPLPAGGVAVFEDSGGRTMLAGEFRLEDIAIGEAVEMLVGESPEVMVSQRLVSEEPRADDDDEDESGWRLRRYEIEITNAYPRPVEVETMLPLYGEVRFGKADRKLRIKEGRRLWVASVPANGRATLAYSVVRQKVKPDEDEDEDEDEED